MMYYTGLQTWISGHGRKWTRDMKLGMLGVCRAVLKAAE
jgi:hypothetical protein